MCDDDCCECLEGLETCFGADCCGKCTGVFSLTLFFGLLLTAILVPISLQYCDYLEICLSYDTVTRELGTEPIGAGIYNFGPSGTMLKWRRTQYPILLRDEKATTSDSVTVELDLHVLYQIEVQNLRVLVDNWETEDNHFGFLKTLCNAVLLDVVYEFRASDFFLQRAAIQNAIQSRLVDRFNTTSTMAVITSVEMRNVELPDTIKTALVATTEAQQSIENALAERDSNVLKAVNRQILSRQEAELKLINARRDVLVTNQEGESERRAETERLTLRTTAFKNISALWGRGGDFFVTSYLDQLVAKTARNTVFSLDENKDKKS